MNHKTIVVVPGRSERIPSLVPSSIITSPATMMLRNTTIPIIAVLYFLSRGIKKTKITKGKKLGEQTVNPISQTIVQLKY